LQLLHLLLSSLPWQLYQAVSRTRYRYKKG
jgi:hypothetical protein